MSFNTSFIGDSSTMCYTLEEDTTNLAYKVVQFTEDGGIELAESPDFAIGLVTGSVDAVDVSGEKLTYGGSWVTVLVKNRGLATAGTPIVFGELLGVNEEGCVVSYSGEGMPFGRAYSSVGQAGDLVMVKIF